MDTNISGTPTYNPIDTNPIDTNPIDTNTSLRNRIRRVIPELIEITLYNNGRRVNTQNINDEVELQDVEISPSLTTIINNSSVSLYNNETYEQDSCRICMETLNTDDIIRKLNTCNHTFHLTCIDQWFRNHTRCPICRNDIRDSIEEDVNEIETNDDDEYIDTNPIDTNPIDTNPIDTN